MKRIYMIQMSHYDNSAYILTSKQGAVSYIDTGVAYTIFYATLRMIVGQSD